RELATLEKPNADRDARLRVEEDLLAVRVPRRPAAFVPAEPGFEEDLLVGEPSEDLLSQLLHEFLPPPLPVRQRRPLPGPGHRDEEIVDLVIDGVGGQL